MKGNAIDQGDMIKKWCCDVITGPGGLQDFEYHEMATPTVDRDVAIAMWVVRALGNGTSVETQTVVDIIVARRTKTSGKKSYAAGDDFSNIASQIVK